MQMPVGYLVHVPDLLLFVPSQSQIGNAAGHRHASSSPSRIATLHICGDAASLAADPVEALPNIPPRRCAGRDGLVAGRCPRPSASLARRCRAARGSARRCGRSARQSCWAAGTKPAREEPRWPLLRWRAWPRGSARLSGVSRREHQDQPPPLLERDVGRAREQVGAEGRARSWPAYEPRRGR